MGCGVSSAQGPAPAGEPLAAAKSAGSVLGAVKGTFLTAQELNARKLALQLTDDARFWQLDVFQNLASADGKPHDARVLELLLDDKADARMQRAAVSVYTEGAVAEWGDAVLDASQAVPHLAASFGIMANIMTKVLPQQPNRQNCKQLQETVRSVALALAAVLRRLHATELKHQAKHVQTHLLELIRALNAVRCLLGNYSHEQNWVLTLPSAKLDKTRFEALHFFLELVTQRIIRGVSAYQWQAPICDFTGSMERLVSRMAELTGKNTVRDIVTVLAASAEPCAQVAAALRLEDPAKVQAACAAALATWEAKARQQKQQQQPAEQQGGEQQAAGGEGGGALGKRSSVVSEQRQREAAAAFESLKAAAQGPKTHSYRTKTEAAAAKTAPPPEDDAAKAAERGSNTQQLQQRAASGALGSAWGSGSLGASAGVPRQWQGGYNPDDEDEDEEEHEAQRRAAAAAKPQPINARAPAAAAAQPPTPTSAAAANADAPLEKENSGTSTSPPVRGKASRRMSSNRAPVPLVVNGKRTQSFTGNAARPTAIELTAAGAPEDAAADGAKDAAAAAETGEAEEAAASPSSAAKSGGKAANKPAGRSRKPAKPAAATQDQPASPAAATADEAQPATEGGAAAEQEGEITPTKSKAARSRKKAAAAAAASSDAGEAASSSGVPQAEADAAPAEGGEAPADDGDASSPRSGFKHELPSINGGGPKELPSASKKKSSLPAINAHLPSAGPSRLGRL